MVSRNATNLATLATAFPSDLDLQFLIGDRLGGDPFAGTPHAARDISLRSLTLRAWPRCRVARVTDAAGQPLGAFIGIAVDPAKRRVISDGDALAVSLANEMAAQDRLSRVEDEVYKCSGSWAFVLDIPDARRLYLDACGSKSAVFDADARLAGATAMTILDREAAAERFEAELYADLDVEREGWFPAGLTAHRGIERLMPNHALDLDTWVQSRHWPTAEIETSRFPEREVGVVLEQTRSTVEALSDEFRVSIGLTAGNETRFVLAACRNIAENIEFMTAEMPGAALDVKTAIELSTRFGLKHKLLPHRLADAGGALDWQARAGLAVGGGNKWNHPTVDPLAEHYDILINGSSGEVGRAFFWRRSDSKDTNLDAANIVARLGMSPNGILRKRVALWLESIEYLRSDSFLILDLAYLELRMASWGYAQSYVRPHLVGISPMISRASFTSMLSLPLEWRRDNRLILDGIKMAWPELLEFPINRYGDWRDQARPIVRAAKNPHLVIKKLRKMFG